MASEDVPIGLDFRAYNLVANIEEEAISRPYREKKRRVRGKPSLREVLTFLGGITRLQ